MTLSKSRFHSPTSATSGALPQVSRLPPVQSLPMSAQLLPSYLRSLVSSSGAKEQMASCIWMCSL